MMASFDLRALSRAAASGDVAVIREHLAGGGDPNAGDARSGTVILHDAAYFKQPEIVKMLLAAGANASARNRDGREPLQLAIEFPPRGPIAMVVGGSFRVFDTPEALRSREGQLEIVRMLLDAGASPNPPIANALLFSLPLESAAKLGDVEIVQLLLARGADPNRGSPLVDAVNKGHRDVVRALLEGGANANQRQRGGATALLRSVDATEVVIADARIAAERQKTPFGDAERAPIRARMREITKALLDAGADRSLGDDRGSTPLDSAKRTGDDELVRLLS